MKLSQFTSLPPRDILAMHRRAANWSLALYWTLPALIAANAWFIGNIPIHLVLTVALLVFGPLMASCQRVVYSLTPKRIEEELTWMELLNQVGSWMRGLRR